MFPVWDTLLVSKCSQIYGLPIHYIVVVKSSKYRRKVFIYVKSSETHLVEFHIRREKICYI